MVSGLVDFDDVSYDTHAGLLYDLARQVVIHLWSCRPDDHEVRKMLSAYQRENCPIRPCPDAGSLLGKDIWIRSEDQ